MGGFINIINLGIRLDYFTLTSFQTFNELLLNFNQCSSTQKTTYKAVFSENIIKEYRGICQDLNYTYYILPPNKIHRRKTYNDH